MPQRTLSDVFLEHVQEANRFDTYLDGLFDTLHAVNIDGFYYWTYDKGALPKLLKGTLTNSGIVTGARGPLHLKPLEILYWHKKWYLDDPTLLATENRNQPFRTKDVVQRNGKKRPIFDYLQALFRFGVTQDLFIPIHTPQRIQALYLFTMGDPTQSHLTGAEHLMALSSLAYTFGNGIADFHQRSKSLQIRTPLTIREQECLTLLASGRTTQEISETLGLRPRTAKFHIENIMRKLDARTRAQAVAKAAKSLFLTD